MITLFVFKGLSRFIFSANVFIILCTNIQLFSIYFFSTGFQISTDRQFLNFNKKKNANKTATTNLIVPKLVFTVPLSLGIFRFQSKAIKVLKLVCY